MTDNEGVCRVTLLAIPDVMISTLNGLYDVLGSFGMLSSHDYALPKKPPFVVDIVALSRGLLPTASGLPVQVHRAIHEVARTDLVIVPSVMVANGEWQTGRYPEEVAWLASMHAAGATLCSACSGLLLLAETGLLSGKEGTMHWAYAATFRRNFPDIRLRLEKSLVTAGGRSEFVMSGATTSWHDLVLYLITRYAGSEASQVIARFFALQWHSDGLSPYMVFDAPTDHGDAVVLDAQLWLDRNFSAANAVEEIVKRAGIPERSFKRRFTQATGIPPISYVQRLRIEDAKRRLERMDASIDEISWKVGYEDPAFFRRLFRRLTGVAPSAYRRKYRVPRFADPRTSAAMRRPA